MKKNLLPAFLLLCFAYHTHAQIITTVAGDGGRGYTGDGGLATAAELAAPLGVAIDNSGNLYIADEGNVIRKVNTSGIISTIAGTGYGFSAYTGGYTGDGGPATAAELFYPDGVAVDTSGNVYIDDQINNVIRKVNTSGIISTVVGNGYEAGGTGPGGYSGDGGPATEAELSYPAGVAVDNSGNLYIADQGNNCIRKVNTSGIITTIVGNTILGYAGNGGPAIMAELDLPVGIAIDNLGNLYIADWGNNVVRKVNTSGIISTIAGNGYGSGISGAGAGGYSGDGGAATLAELFHPAGVSVDASGNVYISDNGNNVIRKVNISGIIGTYAGDGISGHSGDDGPATNAEFDYPYGIAFDNVGNLYIADAPVVRKIGSIIGASSLCIGDTTVLTNVVTGGTWSSGSTTVATINASTGLATGVSVGLTTITYTLSGHYSTATITVAHPPAAITGALTVCSSTETPLSDAITGGTWSSGTTSIANIDPDLGILNGLSAGTTEITYSTAAGCFVDTLVTVIPGPTAIYGLPAVCLGMPITLSDGVTGGTWSSSNTSIATVGVTTGIVTGVSLGTANISYTLSDGCAATAAMLVGTAPIADPITGTATVCVGSTVTLADAVTGGHWYGASTGYTVAEVNVFTGAVTGLSAGIDVISYLVSSSCSTAMDTFSFTVNPLPDAGIITGTDILCIGSSAILTDTAAGGAWTTGSAAIATVTATGIVYAAAAGTCEIVYTATNSCGSANTELPVTVLTDMECNALSAGKITGSTPARLVVFPNPNDGTFSINVLSYINEQTRIVITNIVGEKADEMITNTNSPFNVKLNAPPGIYFLTATTARGTWSSKIMIE